MKRRPDLKIANNFDADDEFSIRPKAYAFENGLHERYRQRFEGRLKVLLNSGIYGLWSQWERMRFSMRNNDDQKLGSTAGSPGDPISFENSSILWLFLAQTMAWLAALVAFLAEKIYKTVPRNFYASGYSLLTIVGKLRRKARLME